MRFSFRGKQVKLGQQVAQQVQQLRHACPCTLVRSGGGAIRSTDYEVYAGLGLYDVVQMVT